MSKRSLFNISASAIFFAGWLIGGCSCNGNKEQTLPQIPAPLNLTATVSGNEVILAWQAPDYSGSLTYEVQRGMDVSSFSSLYTTSATSYADTSVEAGKTYWYRVRAWAEASLHSGFAGPVSVTVPSTGGPPGGGAECTPGETRSCGSSVGECVPGTQTCQEDGTWGGCVGAVGPSAEVCDGKDNDCDGQIDENLEGCWCRSISDALVVLSMDPPENSMVSPGSVTVSIEVGYHLSSTYSAVLSAVVATSFWPPRITSSPEAVTVNQGCGTAFLQFTAHVTPYAPSLLVGAEMDTPLGTFVDGAVYRTSNITFADILTAVPPAGELVDERYFEWEVTSYVSALTYFYYLLLNQDNTLGIMFACPIYFFSSPQTVPITSSCAYTVNYCAAQVNAISYLLDGNAYPYAIVDGFNVAHPLLPVYGFYDMGSTPQFTYVSGTGEVYPSNVTITLSDQCKSTNVYVSSYTTSVPWISLGAFSAPKAVSFTITPDTSQMSSLAPGTYSGYVFVDGTGRGSENLPFSISTPVYLEVYQRVFFDDFEGSVAGWTYSGLWHRADNGELSSCSMSAYSPTKAFWYGQQSTCSYNTGVRNAGMLTSPVIDISGMNSVIVRFMTWEETEGSPCYLNDSRELLIADASNNLLYDIALCNDYYPPGLTATWLKYTYQVPEFVLSLTDQIRLIFYFDTRNSSDNAHRGWMVDDVEVLVSP